MPPLRGTPSARMHDQSDYSFVKKGGTAGIHPVEAIGMKIRKRVLSVLLSICMCISCFAVVPYSMVATGTAESEEGADFYLTSGGERITALSLSQDERVTIYSEIPAAYAAYPCQWQVLADIPNALWVDILDMTGPSAEMSYALLASVMDASGSAYVRLTLKTQTGRLCTAPVCVTVQEAVPAVSSDVGLRTEPVQAQAPVKAARRMLAAAPATPEFVNITINYLYADDPDAQHVAAPYTARVAYDAAFSQFVMSKTSIGFAPYYSGSAEDVYLADNESISVTMDETERSYTFRESDGAYVNDSTGVAETDSDWLYAIRKQIINDKATVPANEVSVSYTPGVDPVEDIVINVYYKAVDVPYSVKYYFQNINDDGYTQNGAISFSGMAKTGTIVSDEVLYQPVFDYFGITDPNADYGFSPLYHYPESVAADGSTVFECYYDRNYYLMKFDMDGGYGVEPIYARYGASFAVTPPTKAGYVFVGWDEITRYEFKVYADSSKETYLTTITLDAEQYALNGSPSAYSESFDFGGTTYPNAYFTFESSCGDGVPDEAASAPHTFTGTIRAESVSYKALWQRVNTTYTIVYWAENADDTDYSYWGNKSVSALSATELTDYDAIVAANPASSASLTDAQYFTYYSAKTKFVNGDRVIVEGDGSTIINVYYSRNTYDILFYDTGSCVVPEHTHTDACYEYDCTEAHVHTADCCVYGLDEKPHTEECCSLEEHTHSEDCLIDTCPLTEHTHTAACYTCVGYEHTHTDACCSKEVHTHTDACCSLTAHTHGDGNCDYLTCTQEEHTHSISCYTTQTGYTLGTRATDNQGKSVMTAIANLQTGHVYRYRRNTSNDNYIWFYDGANWYYLGTGNYRGISGYGTLATPTGNGSYTVSSQAATMICGKTEHTHVGSCYSCGNIAHTHGVSCYPGATATTATGTNYSTGRPTTNLRNGQVYTRTTTGFYGNTYRSIYINGTWYVYEGNVASGSTVPPTCGMSEHTHTGECCTLSEHTHGNGTCVYDCGKTPHTHDDGTCTYTKCGLVQHTHTDDCYNCNGTGTKLDEHTHSDACRYKCGMAAHTHSADCCIYEAHTHSAACAAVGGSYRNYGNGYYFKLSTTALENLNNATAISVNGVTMYYNSQASTNQQYLYYKIGDRYYQLLYGTNSTVTCTGYTGNTGRYSTLTINFTCTKNEHTHGDGTCFCSKPVHEHTDSCYDCGKTEHTHGDGTCNVLGCTDPTHHIHTEECLICGNAAEHVHTADCPRVLVCTQPEHSHTDGTCRTTVSGSQVSSATRYLVYKITAKYNADIHAYWPVTGYNGTQYTSANAYRWDPDSSNDLGLDSVLVYMDRMPGMENETNKSLILLAQKSSGKSNITMHYCVQTIPGDSTAEYTNYLGETATVSQGRGNSSGYQFVDDYRLAGAYYSGVTMDVDFIDLDGFTKYRLYTSNDDVAYANNTARINGTQDYFYYLRNQYTLSFYNYNADWGESSEIYYEQNMNPYNPGEPDYPSSLEPNAYRFEGWYTTPECYPGTEFDWTATNKMPAKDVKLYAKWVPVQHMVRFFETYDDMIAYEASVAAGTPDESLVYVKASMPDEKYTVEVDHGSPVGNLANPDKLVVTNPNGTTTEYDFSGWFIVENEQKKAFTPLDMPITGDTNVYADWGTHTAQPYAVHYALDNAENDSEWLALLQTPSAALANKEVAVTKGGVIRNYICLNDGTDTAPVYKWHRVIADATRGYAYQGTTRTFAAKAGDIFHQLYDVDIDFNAGYYPTPASHSITMVYEENSLEPVSNVFTFRYVNVPQVDYTVRYLDASTGEPLLSERTITTGNAVVTERFKSIANYIPDAFYKQCILAVIEDPENPGSFISSPENIITFYYSKDETSARYTVHFLLQKPGETLTDGDYAITFNADGTYNFSSKFEESGSRIDGIADKDTSTPITPIDFAGFDLIAGKAVYADGGAAPLTSIAQAAGGQYYIKPQTSGTDLFLFYQRESYPYKVYYLLYGAPVTSAALASYTTVAADTTGYVLADTLGISPTLTALYGESFSATAPEIAGYSLVSAPSISKPITPTVENNYIIFYYTPLQYTVQYEVWSGGGGELTTTNETFGSASVLSGSTATALSGYEFVGWYVDAACTVPATYSATNTGGKGTTYTDATMATAAADGAFVMPDLARLSPNNVQGAEPNIFYAKFNPLNGDLEIERDNSDNEGNGTQVFIYEIRNNDTDEVIYVSVTGEGSTIVHGLPFGDYTVTQMNDWSHRFDDEEQSVTLDQVTGTCVTFNDDDAVKTWLNGNGDVAVNKKG